MHYNLAENEILKKPSSQSWIPPKSHPTVHTFIEAINNDIDAEIKANNQSIQTYLKVNKKADKCCVALMLDAKDYAEECESVINNTEDYKQLL